MIDGSHVILFSQDPDADRVFFAEVLGFPHVDAGGGWLVAACRAEAAMHPTGGAASHELYSMCDDIDRTIEELSAKGGEVGMYEPRHPRATTSGATA